MENQNQLNLILQGIQDLQQKTSGFYNIEQRVYRLEESFSLLTTQIKVLETHQDSDKENWNKLDLHKDRIRKAEEFIGLIEKIPGGLTSNTARLRKMGSKTKRKVFAGYLQEI